MRHVSLPLLGTVASSISTGGGGGAYTVGNQFTITEALPVTGVRFYWKLAVEATPETVKACLWDSAGTLLKNASVSVVASGVQELLFSSSYSMPALTRFKVSTYNATRYPYFTTSAIDSPIGFAAANTGSYSLYLGGYLVYVNNVYSAGDANPTTVSAPTVQMFGVEPITSPER